ncbi:MAG: AMP-binding protein, partial [Spirochaetales bacterium]|nr:AMP-binding protein [Spirochaetales bacterium]
MFNNLVHLPIYAYKRFGKRISHKFRKGNLTIEKSFEDTFFNITALAKAFEQAGIKKGDKVSFFVNNRYEWIVTDFAIQALSAVGVPRGSDTTPSELLFIFRHSDSSFLVLEDL